MRQVFSFAWRAIAGGVGFALATVLAGALLPAAGVRAPAAPAGSEPGMLLVLMLLAGVVLAAALMPVASGLKASRGTRWILITSFAWITLALNTQIEARIFTTTGAASASGAPFMLATYLAGCAALAGILTSLLPAGGEVWRPMLRLRRLAGERGLSDVAARVGGAAIVFAATYLLFGQVVAPAVADQYRQQAMELRLPGWGEIVLAQVIRGLLFVAACLPVMAVWRSSRRSLAVTLSVALFVTVGGFYQIQAHWFPAWFRIAHSAEILGGSLVFSHVMVALFRPVLALRGTPE